MTRFGIAIVFVAATAATAAADQTTLADSLFDEGKKLMKAGKYEEACAKFEGSLKLADRPGVQLNLADCYEKLGKTASSWTQYRGAARKFAKSGDEKKEKYARDHADALEPMLAYATITLTKGADVEGLEVKLDGVVVPSAAFGSASPIDPGEHLIEASAPDRLSWSSKVTVDKKAAISIEVPILGQETGYGGGGKGKGKGKGGGGERDVGSSDPGKTRRLIGLAVGGVGIASLGTGIAFGLIAKGKWDDARAAGCSDEAVCPDQDAVDLVNSAQSAATLSTVTFTIGLVAIAGGTVLFLTAPKRRERTSVQVTPVIGDKIIGLTLGGQF